MSTKCPRGDRPDDTCRWRQRPRLVCQFGQIYPSPTGPRIFRPSRDPSSWTITTST
jgi:hypothetical protein